ncbi:MAG: site-specific DNA-methyltransferase [Chryseobacterium sp.]|jgi:adenine-specific DNA-methyltransferase|uniref:site-specific DNA-methyltransferase n=1 Tax=Chryseobacterium sp. TaxID=1871047 RepID=UPI0028191205|nr:site-specific DNA-methyltransferase [Chryseobacterium sp.]MDR2235318.1 site-specific DNA-methyltransferase [Chryseobacterium sp.]
MNDKLDLQSTDITSLNIEKIGALFPNCVTETAEGKKIDFDLLKQELSTEIIEGNKERYRLEWPGKREAIVTANIPTNKTLRPVREDSVNFDITENIYIEGDNLEVLKLLQESYLSKIKMIYIDPPYNTGKDFVYKDNFAKAGEKELLESGQKDEYNQKLVANPETNGRYHSDWLSMMYPRLKLARNLLTEDGVIFISIDDNEIDNLKKMSNEIFGENNFIVSLSVQLNPRGRHLDNFVARTHEYVVIYAKDAARDSSMSGIEKTGDMEKEYNLNDNLGPYRILGLRNRNQSFNPITRPLLYYPLYVNPNNLSVSITEDNYHTEKVLPITTEGVKTCWTWSKQKVLKENNLLTGVLVNNQWQVFRKDYLYDTNGNKALTLVKSLWIDKDINNDYGKKSIKNLFDKNIMDFPKSVELISKIIKSGNVKNKDIILDFFSGSATTAHAIMQLNAEDNGSRKYIMVQLPESTDEKSEAYKTGYKNICEIGKERIRRAGNKIKEETGTDLDYGFRVYRLDSSNMQDVYYKPQDYNQGTLDLFADNVKEDRTVEDLVTQVMLDWGLPLSLPIERKTIAGKEIYVVAGDSLYCCFDKDIDETFAKEIATEKPLRIVFRDKGFKDDTAKENVKQLLKQLSPESEMKVI